MFYLIKKPKVEDYFFVDVTGDKADNRWSNGVEEAFKRFARLGNGEGYKGHLVRNFINGDFIRHGEDLRDTYITIAKEPTLEAFKTNRPELFI